MPRILLFFAMTALSLFVARLAADEAGRASPDYDALVKQLEADGFAERQEASEALAAAGAEAIPALERAAQSDSRESSTRAIEILKTHFEGEDEGLKTAAKASLEKIAAGGDEAAARRAKNVLQPPQEAPAAVPGGIQIGGGQIQIQVVTGGNNRRVSVKQVNGVKEIEAEGDDRKVKIVDDPANGIKMEITEKKDGKETTEKFEAKDADELKKKHPEAHKVYEEYSKQQGGIQIRGLRIQAGQVLPVPIAPAPLRPLRARLQIAQQAAKNLEEAQAGLDKAIEDLKARQDDNLKPAIEQLEAAKKQLEEAKAGLGGAGN